jgi:altronate hydrolase
VNILTRPLSPARVPAADLSFEGYLRGDGRVGIRNEIWIIPTVGCINKLAEHIALEAGRRFADKCGGVFAFTHPYGCSQLGEDLECTRKILAGLVRHPNAGGVLVLGLGCENNNIASFRAYLGDVDGERIKFLSAQDASDETEQALALIAELAEKTAADRRTELPLGRLTVGFKCGGSDAFSRHYGKSALRTRYGYADCFRRACDTN